MLHNSGFNRGLLNDFLQAKYLTEQQEAVDSPEDDQGSEDQHQSSR